jgi:hypothetical protein
VGVHPLVEEDRAAVDERVQHQPAAELAAAVGELRQQGEADGLDGGRGHDDDVR